MMKLFEGFYDPILSINKNMYPCMQLTIEILILKRLFKDLFFDIMLKLLKVFIYSVYI